MHELTCAPAGTRASAVRIGRGALDWRRELDGPDAFLLADARVLELHPDIPQGAASLALSGGEGVKSLRALEQVLRAMARFDLPRTARLVACGGGTIGDLGGLAAALYKRGIDLVQVPTTLLAMCDSSVGGKAAVNLPEGKNLVGHVWPAARVLIEPAFLRTLPDAEFAAGLGEVLKVAIGLDAELFALLETQRAAVRDRAADVLEQLIVRAVRAKIALVEQDPFERGPRRLLNLGHTLGHALEAHAGWSLRHGTAVARGLHFAVELAERRALLAPTDAHRCRELLESYGFAITPLPPAAELTPFIARDKKVDGGMVQFVLPCGIGQSTTLPLPVHEVLRQSADD